MLTLQVEEVNLEVITSSQEIESSNKQVTELRRQLQALEINVQAQLTMVSDATTICISDSSPPLESFMTRVVQLGHPDPAFWWDLSHKVAAPCDQVG